ncbi:DUF2029 domain-containing protein [Defluviimonas sp. WL0002]|uniref:DUF2029 domain-containing protein n=1 Tax=Albidovulum marisflavi TaxID=2984159 RepID=A0ABT2ZEM5_9RHOB|nr:glycosyltransferase family 87 protein [Defluviimonas sp. WL0002]MCV2869561.1 DUF2029 domain-containing protein [Defluviimonas sp. WL0002]
MWPEFIRRLLDPVRTNRTPAVALVCAWGVFAIVTHWNSPASDLWGLYMAGHFLAEGKPELVYAAIANYSHGTPPAWQPAVESLGIPHNLAFAYLYPPIWAWLASWVVPLASPPAFHHGFLVLNVSLIAASVFLARRICRPTNLSLFTWCFAACLLAQISVFSQTALFFNQPQIIVTFLVLLSFERLVAGADRTAGAILAVAAAMKLLPGAFLVIMLVEKRWRAAGAFAVTCLVFAGASLLITGPEIHRDFAATLEKASGTLRTVPANASAQLALAAVLSYLGVADPKVLSAVAGTPVFHAISWFMRLFLVAGFALFVRRMTTLPDQRRIAFLLLALSVLLTLSSPIGWLHYYLLPLLLLPALVGVHHGRGWILFYAFAITLTSQSVFSWLVLDLGLTWEWTATGFTALWLAVLADLYRIAHKPAPIPRPTI